MPPISYESASASVSRSLLGFAPQTDDPVTPPRLAPRYWRSGTGSRSLNQSGKIALIVIFVVLAVVALAWPLGKRFLNLRRETSTKNGVMPLELREAARREGRLERVSNVIPTPTRTPTGGLAGVGSSWVTAPQKDANGIPRVPAPAYVPGRPDGDASGGGVGAPPPAYGTVIPP